MSTSNDRAVLNAILNPLMPTDVTTNDKKIEDDVEICHPSIAESRELEKEGVTLAEGGNTEDSLLKFSKAIEICPVNPSAYNNRAQAYRLVGKVNEALEDLETALKISGGHGKSACQAYVQRAMIYRLKGDDDKARADFESASQLGSSFARMQSVALNPYAAMCNKMLSQVMQELKEPNCSKKE